MSNPVLTKDFLQPAKAAAMCTAPRAEKCPSPPSYPTFFASRLHQLIHAHDKYTRYQSLRVNWYLALALYTITRWDGSGESRVLNREVPVFD